MSHPLSSPESPPIDPSWKTAAFVDVETTGLSSNDEMIELAILLFCFDPETGEVKNVIDQYVGLREPGCPIHPAAAKRHRITPRMLKGKTLDDGRVLAILDQAEFIIAHNVSFDRRFICTQYPALSEKLWLCSLYGIDWKSKGFKKRTLEALLRAHRISITTKHRAEADARAALTLLSMTGTDEKPYFSELVHEYSIAVKKAEAQKLTDGEAFVIETIKAIVGPGDLKVGYYKTKSYISVGFEDGSYWFVRFWWGPRAKYIVLNQAEGYQKEQRINIASVEDLHEHAMAIRSTHKASLDWYETAQKYKGQPYQRTYSIHIDASKILASVESDKDKTPKTDVEHTPKTNVVKDKPKGSCLGCLGGILVIIAILYLLAR